MDISRISAVFVGYVALIVQLAAAALSAEIEIQRLFGPEVPGRYKHPAAIEELQNGDLFLVYYGGEGEYEGDTAVFGSRLANGSDEWTAPQVIADTPFRSEGNAVIWQAPDGLVWLFYVCRYGDTWSTSRIKAKISRDHARTWSDSFMLSLEEGFMVRNRPIVLDDGDYLLPIYHEMGEDRKMTATDTSSFFLRYSPSEKEWVPTNRIRSRTGNLQPGVVQLTDEYLVCYCRRAGDYEPTNDGWIVRAESRDGGHTWSPGEDTKFPNPNAAVDFLKLKNGHLLLVYNDSMNERNPLTASISTDNDQGYPYRRNIIEGRNSYAYPYVIQTSDEKIHVVFTTERRTVIMHAVFDEDAILTHPVR